MGANLSVKKRSKHKKSSSDASNNSDSSNTFASSASFDPSSLSQTRSSDGNFQYIDGRRYHIAEQTRYALPDDDEEVYRLQVVHYLLRYVWNSNFSAPVEEMLQNGAHVLDVGCGPGTWTLELASEYQQSTFVGVDISPMFPSEIKPKNVSFLQLNATKGLPFPDDTFDYVFIRWLTTAFTEEQWKNAILPELVRVCKPNGWIELGEPDLRLVNLGTNGSRWNAALSSYLSKIQVNPSTCYTLLDLVSSFDSLSELSTDSRDIKLGSWGGKEGALAAQDCSDFMKAMGPRLYELLGMDGEEYARFVETVMREFDTGRSFMKYFRIWIRKEHEMNGLKGEMIKKKKKDKKMMKERVDVKTNHNGMRNAVGIQ
ncbi:10994_t:CDS:2 [Paraglomus occultum]|uniref:10994_t:CDS:1 n=1 Tax=Paraglomus occultum TaxID=144539 RepID=A0A9N9ACY3_9GLOM|nr:10994_t:CDS:2 [Paraglomus occultum]